MRARVLLALATLASLVACATPGPAPEAHSLLAYAPAPPDNPLKGLVPYAGDWEDPFPHSLEFSYLPLAALVVGRERYDWSALERLLDDVAGRGHQTIFRIYLEYPHAPTGIPAFLIEDGLVLHRYVNDDVDPPAEVETPDYENPALRTTLVAFVEELGRRYDGDPRIGYVTAGLLGAWGEWHDYPRADLFASKAVQREILDAYERSFRVTRVLLRRPAGKSDPQYEANAGRPFGFHDDSFAWATLDTGRPEDNWYFVPLLRAANATKTWKRHPIGGEIRPEAWGRVFDGDPSGRIQDFGECVEATHATWLMDSGMFGGDVPHERRARAIEEVRRLGYELSVRDARFVLEAGLLRARIDLANLGVAPFYYDWPAELGVCDASGAVVRRAPALGRIADLLPGKTRVWREELDLGGLAPGTYRVVVRVPNALAGAPPVRFANLGQDLDAEGWLTLGTIALDPP